ncbi:carbon storage regulator [Tautonia rosea]|uniref:carbon storage regulator n=1 Tax=Tautonia rosea TaxID=2728037 RepID=UPI0014762DA6|nr:carbon storage regulator [Tautonia rosea]
MLVLSRKQGQRFQIGEDIRLTIVRIDRNSIRIGVEAPDGQMIYREELLTREPLDEDSAHARSSSTQWA